LSPTGATPSVRQPAWSSPKEFVADILPHARRVADELGVSPLGVLAQAALETGWGQHVMPGEDGASSLNLFGIKAGGQWEGDAVLRETLEFEDGMMQPRRERFRAYSSLADTFSDYGALLGGQSRYTGVRAQHDDVGGFADALQAAGYATDPSYAEKIKRTAGGDTMRSILAALKQTDLLTLSDNVQGRERR
jgi:flagellar protein FlgJ